MNPKEHMKAIIKLLTPYLMAYPNTKVNEGTMLVYAEALKTINLPTLEAAMLKLIQTSKFFPSVAEIIEAAEEIKDIVCDKEKATAADAWEEVIRQVNDAFIYKKPVFSSPVIEKAALSMGWTSLCNLPVEGMNTARAQFIRIYENELKRVKNKAVITNVLSRLSAAKVAAIVGGASEKLGLIAGGKDGKAKISADNPWTSSDKEEQRDNGAKQSTAAAE